jgi:hypothetical protein
MLQKIRERWMELAELAAIEQDPGKLKALTREISEILEQKQKRLDNVPPDPANGPPKPIP